MEFVRAGFGEDFDASVAELVVLRGEGIGVDANLTDGFFGGQLATAETIDEDGTAARACGGSGEGFEIGLEVGRVV